MDKKQFTNLVKAKCQEIGFSKSGIAKAKYYQNDKEHLNDWLEKKYNGSMKWMEKDVEKRTNILNYYSDSKSVISVALNYFTGTTSSSFSPPFFSNYALGTDYHIIIKSKLKSLLDELKKIDESIIGFYCVDTSPVMEKEWAQRAGIGWIGKHTNLITKDFGSWVFLGELIINRELSYDSPFTEDLCGTCNLCIDECPTDAIVSPYELDSNKCISYLTIEHRGPFQEKEEVDLNNWIYGCDICQEVCPWNIKFSQISNENDFKDRYSVQSKMYEDWEKLTESDYKILFKNSAVKRTKYVGLMRNIKKSNNK